MAFPNYQQLAVRRIRTKRTPEWVKRYLSRRGGPLSTLGALADNMDGSNQVSSQKQGITQNGPGFILGDSLPETMPRKPPLTGKEVKEHCVMALLEIGASEEYCNFFGDILQTEHDMNSAIYRLQQILKPPSDTEPLDPGIIFRALQDLTKSFNQWKSNIDALAHRGKSIPALEIDPAKIKNHRVLKLLCSLETKDVNLQEGEHITIMGTQPNKLKVQTASGAEGFVPALCCILPTPDKTALTATERLRIQLLCSWTECVRKTKHLLSDSLLTTCKKLARDWHHTTHNGPMIAKDRVTRRVRRILDAATRAPHCDYNKLHNCLYSLEKELISYNTNGANLTVAVEKISNLDKAVLCFFNYYKQWHSFRRGLEHSSLRPIRVVESLQDFKRIEPIPRNYKYLEHKMTVENVEVVEEIIYLSDKSSYDEGSGSSGFGCRTEKIKSDQITSTEQEEKKRFIIKGVVDPRDHSRVVSIKDAVAEGIVDQQKGLYVNPDTRETLPIPEAMNADFIRVEFATTTKSIEKHKAIGLITVKSPNENQTYKLTGAVDAVTGEKVTLEEAKRRGLIDQQETHYFLASSNETFPLHEAVMSGWVIADFDGGDQLFETKTYAVSAVVDQRRKKKVPFYEAVNRHLIDKDTGNYVNNDTGEHIYVVDAIRRGFLKAKVIDEASGLDIDAENKMVVEKMDKIRKSVLKSVGVIRAFKEAVRRKSEGENP